MLNLKNPFGGKGENPAQLRDSYGIIKLDQCLHWKRIKAENFYSKTATRWNGSDSPKNKAELATACELPVEQIAWDLSEVNPGTKFINTLNIGYEYLEILSKTAESPEVQLQMITECGVHFKDFCLKMVTNPHLGTPAINYMVNKIDYLLGKGENFSPTKPLEVCKKIFEIEDLNTELINKLSQCLDKKGHNLILLLGYANSPEEFLENMNILPEILDKKTKPNLHKLVSDQDIAYFKMVVSHPNLSHESLLKALENFNLSEITQGGIEILSIITKHPNSTPEIVKIVLDQFNQLGILKQMELLKKDLIDSFYNNPNLPEKPFEILESICSFTPFESTEEYSDTLNLQKSLGDLYQYTKNLLSNGSFDNLIFKIVTEPKFPKELQTEFFKLWLEENFKADMKNITGFFKLEGVDKLRFFDYFYYNSLLNSMANPNTTPTILQMFFQKLDNFIHSPESNNLQTSDIKNYKQTIHKIAYQNPNLIVDTDLNIVDIRTDQIYLKPESGLIVNSFFGSILKAPENTDSLDYVKKVEYGVDLFLSRNEITEYTVKHIINKLVHGSNFGVVPNETTALTIDILLDSLIKTPQGQLILSIEIFKKIVANIFQKIDQKTDDQIVFASLLTKFLSRSELINVFKQDPNYLQDWIYNYFDKINLSSLFKNVFVKSAISLVLSSQFTSTKTLQKTLEKLTQLTPSKDKHFFSYIIDHLLQNPNLTSEMIDEIIVLINGKDEDYTKDEPEGIMDSIGKAGKNALANLKNKITNTKSPKIAISYKTWATIINHSNVNHSTINQIYAMADEQTQRYIYACYAYLLTQEGNTYLPNTSLLENIPQRIWLEFIRPLPHGDINEITYLRNYGFRNNPKNQEYLKGKELPADTTQYLTIANWIPTLQEIVNRTRSSYLPVETVAIEKYVADPDNEEKEYNVAKVLDITNPRSIPKLIADIRNMQVEAASKNKSIKLGVVEKFLVGIDISIDKTDPLNPIIVFTGLANNIKEAQTIAKAFHGKKDLKGMHIVDFELHPQSNLDRILIKHPVKWKIPLNLYNLSNDDRNLRIANINDKLSIFRNVILQTVEKVKKAKIEEEKTYFKKAHELSVSEILTEMEQPEADIDEYRSILKVKLNDRMYLDEQMSRDELEKFSDKLSSSQTNNADTELTFGQGESSLRAVRIKILRRFNEKIFIKNFLSDLHNTNNLKSPQISPKSLSKLQTSLDIFGHTQKSVYNLNSFYDKNLILTKNTLFGGEISYNNSQTKTSGVLYYLQANLETYKNILECEDLPDALIQEIKEEYDKTEQLVKDLASLKKE